MSTIESHMETLKYIQYGQIFDNSIDVIYLVEVTEDKRFIHLDMNTAFIEAIGVEKETVIGHYVDEIEDKELREVLMRKYTSCLEAETKTQFTSLYNLPIGKRTYTSTLSPIRNEIGRIHRIVGVARDITEQKRAEIAIQSKSVLLQSVIESSPNVTIFALDREYNYLTFNQNHSAIMNKIWAHEIALGMNILSCITREDDKQKAKKLFDKALAGESFIDESEYGDENFSRSYWQTYYAPIRDDNGEIIGLTCFTLNITDKREQEKILAAKEQEFRALSERNPDTVARYDRECIRIYANPAFITLSGLSYNELLGKKPSFYNYSVQTIAYEEKLTEAMESGFEQEMEHTWQDKTGRMITSHIRIVPEIDKNGLIHSALAIGRDITKFKELEIRLKNNEQRLKQAQKVAKIGSFELEFPVLKLSVSDEFLHIFEANHLGFQLSFDHFLDAIHPDERVLIDQKFCESLTNKTPFDTVHRILLPDGRIKYIHEKWETIYDMYGNPIRTVGTAQDVSNEKINDLLLEKKEYQYRMLAENYPDIIIRYDLTCKRVYVNPIFEKTFRYPSEKLLGKTPQEHSSLIAPKYFMTELAKVMESGIASDLEVAGFHPNGEMRWYKISLVPEYDGLNVIGVLCVARDITREKEYESTLLKSSDLEKTLSHLTDNIPGFVFMFRQFPDENFIFTYASSGIYPLLGIHPENLAMETTQFQSFVHRDDRSKVEAAIDVSASKMEPFSIVLRVQNERDSEQWIEARATPKTDPISDDIIWYGVIMDVTERVLQQKKLSMMEYFLDNIQEELFLMRDKGEFEYVNQATCNALGYTRDQLMTMGVTDIDPDYRIENWDAHWSYIQTNGSVVVETSHTRKDGSLMPIEVHANYFEFGGTEYNLAIVHDITERKEIQREIEFLAHHDALTQLPNRILAKHRAEHAIEFAKRHDTKTAFLFIDLDGFKTVNDFLGHSAGDSMLKIIASRLQSILRESDTISRQGGDEFLFILSDIKEANDIITITKKILHELQKPFEIGLHTLSASASIGISIYPEHGETFDQLLQNADTAMYKAKESGKNTYSFYSEEMNHSLIEQFQIQNDLKSALQNNEFVLFYQPQIDLTCNRIIGAEALIRWSHPQLGMVPPMSFIPIAESSGQIIQIGQWVIEEACRQGARWHKQGIEIAVAVNISAIQFKRGNLETVIRDSLTSSGLNPQFLELELTETIMMHDAEKAIESVRSLKKLGIQISIDDFGTGYSSLGYLKRFSVDKLKIDQSFVRDILSDQDDAVIVNTIIQMAKNLNLKTIAEGVENAEVLGVINSYGCDEVQGYHFAKPMKAADFETYHACFVKTE